MLRVFVEIARVSLYNSVVGKALVLLVGSQRKDLRLQLHRLLELEVGDAV